MKKSLVISLFAVLAILPSVSMAIPYTEVVPTGGFRVAHVSNNSADANIASDKYVKGAYNANVDNINNALEYVETGTVDTINDATVSADNVSLTVDGFTPSGTVSVDSSNATITGTVNVPTTVQVLDLWGSDHEIDIELGGVTATNINAGATVSGVTAEFNGTATGQLSGTGSFSDASVYVDSWHNYSAGGSN